jgi:hypothetical protein
VASESACADKFEFISVYVFHAQIQRTSSCVGLLLPSHPEFSTVEDFARGSVGTQSELTEEQNRNIMSNLSVGAAAMAEVTYYVALPFVAADDGIAVGNPMECLNPIAVAMRAEALSRKRGHIGAVAFSRTGDPATGDFNDVEVFEKFGEVADDLSAL